LNGPLFTGYSLIVSTLAEIEAAIAELPPPEFRELLHKLIERDAAEWDRQMEADAENGNLDRMYTRLMEEEGSQPTVPLDEVINDPELS
jgi:hypothetical protein